MKYSYEEEKSFLFTDDGQRMFLKIRDNAKRLLREAGAFALGNVIQAASSGNDWQKIACVDRLVELGEIREITGDDVAGQFRVFVDTNDSVF